MRVLVTSAGGALAPLNIRLLKQCRGGDIWVLAVDMREDAAGRYFADAFSTVPGGGEPGYVEAIADCVEHYEIDIVLPWSDEEALALAAGRERIEQASALLVCASLETLKLMADKAHSYELLGKKGVALPRWAVADTVDQVLSSIEDIDEDGRGFAVKPTRARGNRGTFVVSADAGEAVPYLGSREMHMSKEVLLRDFLDEIAFPAMIMERLVPPAFDIDILAKDGKLLRAMPRRRLNPAGVPFTGGVLEPRAELLALAEQITSALGLSWLYDYDIMTTLDGVAVPLELNPRPSGSIAAAILGGVPFYENLISLVRGELVEPMTLPENITVIPHLDCLVVDGGGAG